VLTIFTVPKPFAGHVGVIQRNALASWARLPGDVEIIVCGDEAGTAAAAAEVGAIHVEQLERNEFGTPRVDSLFESALRVATRPVLVYANADLILLSDLPGAIARIGLPSYLVAGRRRNISVRGPLDFDRAGWDEELRRDSMRQGRLEHPWGSDYFVFPAELPLGPLPPFAVGRPFWDNWLFYRARALGIPVVDATKAIVPIHQMHGYEHIPGGSGEPWDGPEADANRLVSRAAQEGQDRVFHLWDATHLLTERGLRRARGPQHLWRRLKMSSSRGLGQRPML
jgi:hypothetical protein